MIATTKKIEIKTIKLFQKLAKLWSPPPLTTVSDWADNNRVLSRENASEAGQWRTDRAPYQREIMDSINNAETEKVVIMSSAQVGKSEILNNAIGYFITNDPGPMLMIQPTSDVAKSYSKERIAYMIRDSKVLNELVHEAKTRDSDNTILMKVFPGGFLAIGGANSPAGLASKPIRILLADEVDRYPVSAGTEGDPLALGEKRTITFWNRKKIIVSTPVLKGSSRIEVEYKKGSQEKWMKECPHCGEYIFLNIAGMRYKVELDEDEQVTISEILFQCPACLEQYDEFAWKLQQGKWIAKNPKMLRVRSFHMNAFISPWFGWEEILREYEKAKGDPEQEKVVTNTLLGETYEQRGEISDLDKLVKRREKYEAQVPDGVLILTAGVDVQGDRLEYEVIGWGEGEESWGIEYGIIFGNPSKPDVWKKLSQKLSEVFYFKSGLGVKISCTCIDSGGHSTQEVYAFCKANEYRRIFAIKGYPGQGTSFIHKVSRSKLQKAAIFILGVDNGKSVIYGRLKENNPGPGFCHYPDDNEKLYDLRYFEGLTAEKIEKVKSKGQIKFVWVKVGPRNEPLDVRNYGYGALKILNPNWKDLKNKLNNAKIPENPQDIEKIEEIAQKIENMGKKPRKRGLVKKGLEL